MTKKTYRTPQGLKEITCRVCNKTKVKIDPTSVSAVCYKCVSAMMNPGSKFLEDMSPEEYTDLIKKLNANGRSENNPA
jgi:hypothetical protein